LKNAEDGRRIIKDRRQTTETRSLNAPFWFADHEWGHLERAVVSASGVAAAPGAGIPANGKKLGLER
jgi:hypothetical protein